jgi:hypothetical protein
MRTLPISPLVGEMPGRAEGGNTRHKLSTVTPTTTDTPKPHAASHPCFHHSKLHSDGALEITSIE